MCMKIVFSICNTWCEINHRKNRGFFVLDFVVNIGSISCYDVHYFVTKL